MTSTKKRSLVMLVFSVAMLGMSLFATSPAEASLENGHFHGGSIIIGNGTIIVPINDCTPLFEIAKTGGGTNGSGTFHCDDIPATGPLGDALVDLLCVVNWQWPAGVGTHANFNCLLHIFIETFLGDFLCNLHGAWLTSDATASGSGFHWAIANAAPGFGDVQVTGQCPALIASAIDDFVASGVNALLRFLFT